MKNILFFASLIFVLNSCNENTHTEKPIELKSIFPDSIIDSGIRTKTIYLQFINDDNYFAKASSSHSSYNFLKITSSSNKEKMNELYASAISNYKLSMGDNEKSKDVILTNMASLKLDFGDWYGALQNYEELIKIRPDFLEYKLLKAYCLLKTGEIQSSEIILSELLKEIELKSINNATAGFKNSTVASTYYFIGILNYYKGKKKEGCQAWSKSSEIDKDFNLYVSSAVIERYCK